MSDLISDLLDLTRGRLGGGIAVDVQAVVDIKTGMLDVVTELRHAHPDRSIDCELDDDITLRFDRGRIQQVVSNLLGNALLHGSPSTPVKLRVTRGESDLIVEVHNQGDPIPPESIDKLFQPFWRRSTSASRKGLGLGLYICSQIVAAHKGRIQVKSAQEDGTRFTVHLPVA
jgi:signal transduction histidine kinase